MSVKSLIAVPEVRARLDEILPDFAKLPSLALRVPPRTSRYALVGTAFDYALRFELQRRNRHAVVREWVAERALERIPLAADLAGLTKSRARVLGKEGARILKEAKRFTDSFLNSASPDFLPLATQAVLLAKLDNIYRAYQLDPELAEVDPDDANDVATLLGAVPFEMLSHPKVMLLNPTFGTYSSVAGGADADLICGDALVEVKTTKNPQLKPESIRQLLLYFMLASRARAEDRSFPVVRTLGIYFSRHAHLWRLPTKSITDHPEYPETEEWLIGFAAKTELDPELRELWEMMQYDARAPANREKKGPKPPRGRAAPKRRR
jgi:hypothetical protein